MNRKDLERWLSEDEWSLHTYKKIPPSENAPTTDELLESLVRCRRLNSRAHSFLKWLNEQTAWPVESPHRDIGTLVKDLAAEIDGFPRKIGGEGERKGQ